MTDQKLSALPLITPTGAERVYLDNGTDNAQANQLGFANGHFSVCPSAGGTPVTIP